MISLKNFAVKFYKGLVWIILAFIEAPVIFIVIFIAIALMVLLLDYGFLSVTYAYALYGGKWVSRSGDVSYIRPGGWVN